MNTSWSRRRFLGSVPGYLVTGAGVLTLLGGSRPGWAQTAEGLPHDAVNGTSMPDVFPGQDREKVKELVGASHSDLAKVTELVTRQPGLVRASHDWGFGDWETPLGAASHTGRREIAEFLLARGAEPTIFSAAMMGELELVKAMVAARPGVQRLHGPHGLTLLHHARAGGEAAAPVAEWLTALGDADAATPREPLDPADRDRLAGRYVFGPGPRDRFDVDVRNGQLGIERPGGTRRTLFHAGGMAFFPAGAPAVRIAFELPGDRMARLTVSDPDVLVTATRS